ncbi:MAG TPA: triple tyrosine motif-containing protein [Candidatus Brocadiaceae bacterium]
MIFIIMLPILLLAYPLPVEGKNLLENSSFELGASHGWALSTSDKITSPLGHFDTTTAYHGTVSLKLEYSLDNNAQSVGSKIYRLKPNQQYTLSFYAKSPFSAADITFQVKNTFNSPYGPGDTVGPYKFKASNIWQRFSFTFTTTNNSAQCSYQIIFSPSHQGFPNQFIWVDAIQLEEGTQTAYNPKSSIEISLLADSNHNGNIFFEDEQIVMKLRQYNNSVSTQNITIKYEVYDYYNKVVKSGKDIMNAPSQSLSEKTLDISLSQNRRGAFRVIIWVEGINGTLEEKNYSVLPRPITLGINESSIIGSHVPFNDYFLSLMQKVGIKWNRTLSTGKQFRWNLIEPTKGNFIWKDDEIDRAAQYGMRVLGTIGNEIVHVPDWAKDVNGLPKLDEWNSFVSTVVGHYKDKVDYWEIWNEPDTEGARDLNGTVILTASYYGEILKTAYNAIKGADPNAKAVGMVAYYKNFVQDVLNAIGPNFDDLWSSHRYPPLTPSHTTEYMTLANSQNKTVWNSETGAKTDTFYQTTLWEDLWISYAQPDDWGRDYRLRTDWLIQNFAQTVGVGFKKYFYYDARNSTAPDFLITYSFFEWDGTLRPKAVAYSILANLFDGSVGQGIVNIHSDVESYLFLRGTTPLIILWTKNTSQNMKLNINLPSTKVKIYNIMGNESSVIDGVVIGRSPFYLEGQGITKEELINGLSISNTNDTVAPNLSIVTFPTGPINENNILLRWFAVDDTSVSTRGQVTPESISYSYKLEGYDADWSTWVTTTSTRYNNIPIGDYIFHVRAKDAVGNIVTTSVNIAIKSDILAPVPPLIEAM